ncbi:hypothetical protein OG992_11690 [Micromonospora sp. NBC_00362]|uniref:hypothetical protein n=1 Tax=Micromonospora sp. NBC_00362 TaxID=2975975 RepID=UPI002259DA78|nr:hypothetical protein [Micromonospora sp. NBC_00362]MCX5117845.1 hypothetical protein [Micromonospora sp. NBC_00362]
MAARSVDRLSHLGQRHLRVSDQAADGVGEDLGQLGGCAFVGGDVDAAVGVRDGGQHEVTEAGGCRGVNEGPALPDPGGERRVLVAPVPDRLDRVTAVWDDLGQSWQALLDEHTDEELEVITRHMDRAHDLSHAQMRRLRSQPKPD